MQRRVITGISGALGRALVAASNAQPVPASVVGLARCSVVVEGATIEVADLKTARFSELIRPADQVFHLAAFVHRIPRDAAERREVQEVNHFATARLAQACRDAGARLIFASTVAVSASTEYGKSKAAAEAAIRELGAAGLDYCIVRFPLLFGPHGRGNMERMLQSIRARRYWPIGKQDTPKSCLFFDDAARALLLAAERGGNSTFVAAPAKAATLGEIHAAAYAAVGRRVPGLAIPRWLALRTARGLQAALAIARVRTRLPDQIETLTSAAEFDGSDFARATGFVPEVGLDEGLLRTARWLDGLVRA